MRRLFQLVLAKDNGPKGSESVSDYSTNQNLVEQPLRKNSVKLTQQCYSTIRFVTPWGQGHECFSIHAL